MRAPRQVVDPFSLEAPKDCTASALTWDCGSKYEDPFGDDRLFRHEIFQQYPRKHAKAMAETYRSVYRARGRKQANTYLRRLHEQFAGVNYRLATDEDALRSKAKCLAERVKPYAFLPRFGKGRVGVLRTFVNSHGLKLPERSLEGTIQRLIDPAWWRRQLRKKHRRELENIAISLNMVNSHKACYVSDNSLRCHRSQKQRNRALLEAMIAINEEGQEFTLEELASRSTSNPKNRRAELMTRIAGLDQYAREARHAACLYTITCPSRMHSTRKRSGKRNPKYDDTTPRQAQDYLNGVWSRIRAKWARKGLKVYGVRVVEPNHDGTPHWHVLLFMLPEQVAEVEEVIWEHALRDSPDEAGIQERRVTKIPINYNVGSAIGYIAKYISKNVDGHGIEEDGHGNSASEAAERVGAWASMHGIRQFQFMGGPPVALYRELRRANAETMPPGLLREAVLACDGNDWGAFMRMMGGPHVSRRDLPIGLFKTWSDRLGKYGEPVGYQVAGVEYDGVSYPTRIHTWRIEMRSKSVTANNIAKAPKEDGHNYTHPLPYEATNEETGNLAPLEFCQ